jgi:uncharacterized protein (DUF1499 family)
MSRGALAERFAMLGRLFRLPFEPPPPPAQLGVTDGRLAPCPRRPNCVSSYETDAVHGMPAIPFAGGEAAIARVIAVLRAQKDARIAEERPGYVHAEFTTALWRFVDDVEFLWDDDAGVLHFRSASRVGRSDLGANRRRMDRLTRLIHQGD